MFRLCLDNLGKRFGSRVLFDGLTVEVPAGEALVVTGPNGSGKSTLLSVVAGLQRPNRGTMRVLDGEQELPVEAWRRQIGMVAPDLTLYPELTAAENLQFFARVRDAQLTDVRLHRLLERVGLDGRGDDLVRTFSSGMRVRLKYAYALLHEPRILMLDEPTANLDVEGAAMVEEVIREQRERGILILATNDPRELEHGDQIVRLRPVGGAA